MRLTWSPSFERAFRRAMRRDAKLGPKIREALSRLAADPFDPRLHTHKLRGQLAETWACTVDYDCRVVFEFVSDPKGGGEALHLLAVGTHDEVY